MRHKWRWLALAGLLILMMGLMPAKALADGATKRVVTYFANWNQDKLPEACEQLKEACRQGYLTHIIIGLLHLGWADSPANTLPTIHLGQIEPEDFSLLPLWDTVAYIRLHHPQIKVLASFGGGGVGDFRQLLDPSTFSYWYPPLHRMLKVYNFNGLDLDIEENNVNVNTDNVRNLVQQLRLDFGPNFLITSAPVASALTGGDNVSPLVHYVDLIKEPGLFDWYNVQFYNGFGDLLKNPDFPPDYDQVVTTSQIPPQKLVAGVPTAWSATDLQPSHPYYDILQLFSAFRGLTQKYPMEFGGVYGWHFDCAQVGGKLDSVGWAREVYVALYRQDISSAIFLLLND